LLVHYADPERLATTARPAAGPDDTA